MKNRCLILSKPHPPSMHIQQRPGNCFPIMAGEYFIMSIQFFFTSMETIMLWLPKHAARPLTNGFNKTAIMQKKAGDDSMFKHYVKV